MLGRRLHHLTSSLGRASPTAPLDLVHSQRLGAGGRVSGVLEIAGPVKGTAIYSGLGDATLTLAPRLPLCEESHLVARMRRVNAGAKGEWRITPAERHLPAEPCDYFRWVGWAVVRHRRREHRRGSSHRKDTDPVFASRVGTPLRAGNLRRRVLMPAAASAGLEWVGFHTFRHTCASLLFEAGKNARQVADWLGHADPAFTLKTYVHLMDEGTGDAAFLDEAVKVGNSWATHDPQTAANPVPAEAAESAV